MAEQPRLKSTEIKPDVNVNVSTALRELREVEEGLSKTEATGTTLGGAFGTKKSGATGYSKTEHTLYTQHPNKHRWR